MSLSLFFGVLTLTPAVMALAILGLGLAQRARAPWARGLAALGALVPAACLIILVPDLTSGVPFHVALWPGSGIQQSWFAPVLRADNFAIYGAAGVAFLVTPLLLWIGWQSTQRATAGEPAAELAPADAATEPTAPADAHDGGEPGDAEASAPEAAATPVRSVPPDLLRQEQWASLALPLGIEAAALLICFADNILWFGVCWIALAACAWGLGELGSTGNMLDRRGLGVMLAGPVLWIGAMLLVAAPAHAPRFYDLMGHGGTPVLKIFLLALTLALAGGAYPFLAWVRRRAAFTTPAGLGAVVLAVLPAALFAGARTYSALQDRSNLWPAFGSVTPPITAGIAFVILGALTVGVCGLLALGRSDGRSLIALLGSAQVGWGLVALGSGEPAAIIGLCVLLATAVLGLGAMLASLVAGGMVTTDVEPVGAGPHPFGAPLSRANLFAWSTGALALVGAPLFSGFVSREMITAAALGGTKLIIPLLGLAWAGDALLALALLRATAPALRGKPAVADVAIEDDEPEDEVAPAEADAELEATGAQSAELTATLAATADEDEADDDETDEATGRGDEDEADDEEAEVASAPRSPWVFSQLNVGEALGIIFGVLALAIGIVPQWLLAWGAIPAAGDLTQSGTAQASITLETLGYRVAGTEWAPTGAWIALALLAAVFVGLRYGMRRVAAPGALAGETFPTVEEEEHEEESGLAAPADLWKILEPAFHSGWALPGVNWLLAGVEDEGEDGVGDEAESETLADHEAPEQEPAALPAGEAPATTGTAPVTPRAKPAADSSRRGSAGDEQ